MGLIFFCLMGRLIFQVAKLGTADDTNRAILDAIRQIRSLGKSSVETYKLHE